MLQGAAELSIDVINDSSPFGSRIFICRNDLVAGRGQRAGLLDSQKPPGRAGTTAGRTRTHRCRSGQGGLQESPATDFVGGFYRRFS